MASFTNVLLRQFMRFTPGTYSLRQPPTQSCILSHTRTFCSTPQSFAKQLTRATRPLHTKGISPILLKATGLAGVGIGLSSLTRQSISSPEKVPTGPIHPQDQPHDYPPPPTSSVSLYELGFGTVAGLCAGVFVKKGAKALAWFLGGIFVLLQYLGSTSLIRVDWGRAASRFENLFYTKDATGSTRPPTVVSLWHWIIDFLTADFQPRASFIAGFVLGIRVG
ncbi:FUN14 family-domain-containing protein [Crucibulum laeve]|uniref:FUN14 family-domain-containing protein n=1 Tax=Crucibulum laeve TaxID=68775 RepID=A0A5C3MND1_9AGAR|nr:FUN14 family-domain-containing protein [Crucibulum laeve]